ncbi:PepSY domain-containing protein [uncultured Erythrobacter sp.]|uniref:PepSY domain-containing protein n=1 Tax=uncultured Erythrobacter sp. TaxID=263913 RepID=UPI0026354F07|nr:PepSY domain-containing protein [uncultured Erythrobacter sp.]
MKRIRSFFAGILAALSLAMLAGVPASAAGFGQDQGRSDQGEARKEMRAGNQLSLREIERRVLPKMRGSEYLGPAYDSTARAYRLKFIKDGRVTYVDVDARTGRIINRSR